MKISVRKVHSFRSRNIFFR